MVEVIRYSDSVSPCFDFSGVTLFQLTTSYVSALSTLLTSRSRAVHSLWIAWERLSTTWSAAADAMLSNFCITDDVKVEYLW